MSHFITQQISTEFASSVLGRFSFLASFSDDFVFQLWEFHQVKIYIPHTLTMLMLTTDPEPTEQLLNTEPDAASRNNVHWHYNWQSSHICWQASPLLQEISKYGWQYHVPLYVNFAIIEFIFVLHVSFIWLLIHFTGISS